MINANLADFIKDECANYKNNGCILSKYHICKVINNNERCSYFEVFVLPNAVKGGRKNRRVKPRNDVGIVAEYRQRVEKANNA